jgi:hypothetical protein
VKHYSNRDFVRLLTAVENDGGTYSGDECQYHEIDELTKMGHKPALSTGCEEAALFDVAYDPSSTVDVPEPILIEDDDENAPQGRKKQRRNADAELEWTVVTREGDDTDSFRTARVCANDDLMRLWPRYRNAMRDPDPTTGVL